MAADLAGTEIMMLARVADAGAADEEAAVQGGR